MKARMLLAVGVLTSAFLSAGVAAAGQARPRNPESAGSSSGSGSGGSSGGSGSHAVPRSGGGSASGGSTSSAEPTRVRAPRGDAGDRVAVPAYSRPRGNRPTTGQAVDRGSVPGGGGNIIVVPPIYNPWYGGLGWGYFYDPFWWGYGWGYSGYGSPSPYGYYGSGYYGSGYYGSGYYGPGHYGPGYYGGSSSGYSPSDTGSLRLKVQPREAEVYVDGAFVGIVDEFDGTFQKLRLEPGKHHVEIRATDRAPLSFEVLIVRDQTVTYRGELKDK